MNATGLWSQLLGQPGIFYGGKILPLSRRGLRSLVYYLTIQAEPQDRGHLGLMLWDHLGESQMRKNLREYLSRLRHELPDPSLLIVQEEYIQLDPLRTDSDLGQFIRLAEQAGQILVRMPRGAALPEDLLGLIRGALALWGFKQFKPFADLQGTVELEAWSDQLALRVNGLRLSLLSVLADHEYRNASPAKTIGLLSEALELAPLDDTLHQRLVETYNQSGYLREANAALHAAQRTYQHAGLDFPANLADLASQLRERRAPRRGLERSSTHPSLQLPLIGRDQQLAEMNAAYAAQQSILLIGEPGSGKSRLLQEFSARLDPRVRILSGESHQHSQVLPLQTIIDLLRTSLSPREWAALAQPVRNNLSFLFPAWGSAAAEPGPEPPAGLLSQAVIFESLYQVMQALALQNPLLIVLDQAQRLDETSLQALAYWTEKGLFTRNALLLLAYRPGEQSPAMDTFLAFFERETNPREVRLSGLDEDEIQKIIETAFNRSIPPGLASRLAQDTGGNILHILETLRMILASPDEELERLTLGSIPLAKSIYTLVHERLERLSPDALSLLGYAAALGSQFPLELLEQMGQNEGEQLVDLVEELEQNHLIEPQGDGGYRFLQEQVRDIVLMDMSPARRRFVHLRAAAALRGDQAEIPEPRAAVLAELYQRAGEPLEACSAWEAAARYSIRLFAMPEALNAFHKADQIASGMDKPVDKALLLKLYVSWSELGQLMGDRAAVQRAGDVLYHAGWERNDHELLAAGLLGQAAAAELGMEIDKGLVLLESARIHLKETNEAHGWLVFHFRRGSLLALGSRIAEAEKELEQALSQRANNPESPLSASLLAACGVRHAETALLHGWPGKALQIGETALRQSRRAANQILAIHAYAALGTASLNRADFSRARELSQTALEMALPSKIQPLIALMHLNLAQITFLQGDLAASWQFSQAALESNHPLGVAHALRIRADQLLFLGKPAEACAIYEKLLASPGMGWLLMLVGPHLGLAYAALGQTERALELCEQSIAICEQTGAGLYLLPAQWARACLFLQQGAAEQALQQVESLRAAAENRGMAHLALAELGLKMQAALACGRLDEAGASARNLLARAEERGIPWLQIQALAGLSRAEPAIPAHRQQLQQRIQNLQDQTIAEDLRAGLTHFGNPWQGAESPQLPALAGWLPLP